MLEKAVATHLYGDSPQCACVYYNEQIAFNKIARKNCHQKRLVEDGGRCWTSQHKLFYTTGDLTAAMDEICTELPPPPTTTTTLAPVVDECSDDPDRLLSSLPMECSVAIAISGGCHGELHFLLARLFPESTMDSLCPKSCAACTPDEEATEAPEDDEFDSSVDCVDDPHNILGEVNASCFMMVNDPTIGCEDPLNIVPPAAGGHSTTELCPMSCDPRCLQ